MSEQPGGRYIFCEGAAHLDVAARDFPGFQVMALTAECAWACLSRGLPYQKLDNFYDDADVNALAEETMRRHYQWAAWTDESLGRQVPRFAAAGFQPTRACLHFLKVAMDGVLRSGWILQEFARNAAPAEIVGFERGPLTATFPIRAIMERPLFPLLAPVLLGDVCRINIRPNTGGAVQRNESKFRPPVMSAFLRRVRRVLLRRTRRFCRRMLPASCPGPRVLMAGPDYGLDHSMAYLRKAGVSVVYSSCPTKEFGRAALRFESVRLDVAKAWASLSSEAAFWAPSDAVSPLLRSVLSPFLEHWISNHVPELFIKFEVFKEWMCRRSFDAVLGSDVHNPEISMLYAAAGALKIPRILHMHNDGGMFTDFAIQDCIGPWQCDIYLTSSEEDIKYFHNFGDRTGDWNRAEIIAIGSPRLEALRQGIPRKKLPRARLRPRILYVPTMLLGPYRYFNEGSTSDAAYFELQMRILKIFADYPEIDLLYKPYPQELAPNPIEAFLQQEVPNATVIWRPLDRLANEVDAVMVDFPATFFTEAVIYDLPLVVYAGRDWARMDPTAVELLRRRAQVAETADDFEKEVRSLLDKKQFGPLPSRDDSFALRYGIIAEWNAAQCAAILIAKITRNQGR